MSEIQLRVTVPDPERLERTLYFFDAALVRNGDGYAQQAGAYLLLCDATTENLSRLCVRLAGGTVEPPPEKETI